MNCTTCQSLLVEFVYDELDGEKHAAVAAALEHCAECQAELAQLRQTMQVFDKVEALEVPAKLHNDILRSARLAAAEAGPQRSWLASFVASPAFSVAFSGLLLLGGGAAFYQLTYGGQAEYAPASVEVDSVATAAPEAQRPSGAADGEMQFAEELAASAAPVAEASAEDSADNERVVEGRHSLDRAGDIRQAQAENSLRPPTEGDFGDGRQRNDNADFDQPLGGSVTGASSSGSMPPSVAAPIQRGGSAARDPSATSNMMPTPTPNEPGPAPPTPQPEPEEEDEEFYGNERLALGGSLGSNSGRERDRDRRSSRSAVRPSPNDSHAPGSAATNNQARQDAPSPEPTAAVPSEPGAGAGYGSRDLAERYEEALPEAEEEARYADDFGGAAEEESAEVASEVAAAAPSREQGTRGESQSYADETEVTTGSGSSPADDYMDGVDHYDSGNWGRANRALRRYLEVAEPSDSRRAVARYLVGASYYQQGEYRNAERELLRFLDSNPGHRLADEARVLLEDIEQTQAPTNRRNAPSPASDSVEAEPR